MKYKDAPHKIGCRHVKLSLWQIISGQPVTASPDEETRIAVRGVSTRLWRMMENRADVEDRTYGEILSDALQQYIDTEGDLSGTLGQIINAALRPYLKKRKKRFYIR